MVYDEIDELLASVAPEAAKKKEGRSPELRKEQNDRWRAKNKDALNNAEVHPMPEAGIVMSVIAASREAGVTKNTVKRWIGAGMLRAISLEDTPTLTRGGGKRGIGVMKDELMALVERARRVQR